MKCYDINLDILHIFKIELNINSVKLLTIQIIFLFIFYLFLPCSLFIIAGSPNKSIHLQFRTLESECSFDFLFVYDGNSYSSPLLASLSGDSLPSPVTAKSGYVSQCILIFYLVLSVNILTIDDVYMIFSYL